MSVSFHEFFQTQLNQAQQKAVNHTKGSLLVTAGAGSGKTRIITARIVNLIMNEHIHPTAIVALTFTNKAAREMQERITNFLGKLPFMPFIGTFHSYCLYLLKRNAKLLPYETFSIMDADDQHKLLSKLIKRYSLGKQTTARKLAYHISTYKNSSHYEGNDPQTKIEPLVSQVYQAYEHEKELSKCFDFDDLLLETLKLFRKNPALKKEHHTFIRHILVDEYQDTNIVQHQLLKHMVLQGTKKMAIDSLCVVGDEDQSIYSWRGATIANIMNFKIDFPDVTTITIEQNYRSVQSILHVANKVIEHNEQRNPKTLWSERTGRQRVYRITCVSGYQEAEAIAQCAKALIRVNKLRSSAVLYRAHHQSRIIEEALLRHTIPYKIIGGIQFYERAEIKDLLAYLRLIVNPFDRIAASRIINTPARGLGDKFQEQLFQLWTKDPFSTLTDICTKMCEEDVVTGIKQQSVKAFIQCFTNIQSTDSPTIALERIIEKTEYFAYLKRSYEPQDAQAKSDNVKELLQAVQYAEKQGTKSLSAFLDEIALMQEKMHDKDTDHEHIQLMTLHAAKGLEFDTVILVGLEEGLLPSSRSLMEAQNAEEECRLFYVGITRARERLLLAKARFRHTFGSMEHQSSSRFLDHLSDTLAPHEDLSYAKEPQIEGFFAEWLHAPLPGPERSPVITFTNTFSEFIPAHLKQETRKKIHTTGWKKHAPVKHPKFGVGIVKEVEKKGNNKTYITASFKSGIKKIDAKFLLPL
ncbi:UvrD-helicase domain-containing protein [Candidatus Babeliales bacterium]|nr:UvrD-helicase domain-containing protein [Candidatus Babeliales bacterium]